MGIFLNWSLKGILAVKKKKYDKICIIRIVIDFPVHGVYAVLCVDVVLNDTRYPFPSISLYKHIYSEPFFQGERVLAGLIPF